MEDLIDADNGEWNINVINMHFVEPNVSAICGIIPIRNSAEDIQGWQSEKHDNFTIRCAYRELVSKNRNLTNQDQVS